MLMDGVGEGVKYALGHASISYQFAEEPKMF